MEVEGEGQESGSSNEEIIPPAEGAPEERSDRGRANRSVSRPPGGTGSGSDQQVKSLAQKMMKQEIKKVVAKYKTQLKDVT